jgi:hypothetical protein
VLTASIPALVPDEGLGHDEEKVVTPEREVAEPPRRSPSVAPTRPSTNDRRRMATYVATGVGAAGVAAGTYFGVVALLQKEESDPKCPGGVCETSEDLHLYEKAQLNATLSNVGFAVGVVGLGLGTYLFLTEPGATPSGMDTKQVSKQETIRTASRRERTTWVALPTAQADGASLSIMGSF